MRKIILILFILWPISLHAELNFNYGSNIADKTDFAERSLNTAMEKVGDRIYAVGVHGIIMFSDNNADTWTQADYVPYQTTLTDIG